MVGLNVDACRDALSTPTSTRIRGAGPIGAVAAAMLDYYLDWQDAALRPAQRAVHDALAVATLLRPELVTTIDALVTVDTTAGPARGMTLVDRRPLGRSGDERAGRTSASIATRS